MKTEWIKGPPISPGIYWFSAGHKGYKTVCAAQVTKFDTYVFGFGGGTMPLSSVYNESIADRLDTKHAIIPEPTEWFNIKDLPDCNGCWVKTPQGCIGVGLLKKSQGLIGTIIWNKHPTDASSCGVWIPPDSSYEFSPLEIPELK